MGHNATDFTLVADVTSESAEDLGDILSTYSAGDQRYATVAPAVPSPALRTALRVDLCLSALYRALSLSLSHALSVP